MSDETGSAELPEIDEAVVGAKNDQAKAAAALGAAAGPPDLGLIMEVPLRLSVELGSANLLVREVLGLSKGSVVELDRMSGAPADIYINDRLIARGELATQDERVAIRITELLTAKSVSQVG